MSIFEVLKRYLISIRGNKQNLQINIKTKNEPKGIRRPPVEITALARSWLGRLDTDVSLPQPGFEPKPIPVGIYGGQSGTETGFVFSFQYLDFSCQYHTANVFKKTRVLKHDTSPTF